MKIQAAVLWETGKPLVIETVDLAPPKSKEVLVKIGATSICHSDLNAQMSPDTPKPIVLGHEASGTVTEVGENVKFIKPGDKVTLNWVAYCGKCYYCLNDQEQLCDTAISTMQQGLLSDGTTRLSKDGNTVYHDSSLATFAEYVVVDEMSCVKLPDEMPLEQAALLGCGVATGFGAAVNAGEVTPGSTVAIFGSGGVGINAIQGARIAGASKIIALDMKQQNLDTAVEFGATHTFHIPTTPNMEEQVKALTGGVGIDVAIDTTGHTSATINAWNITRRGGTIIVVGVYNEETLSIPASLFHRNEKTIKGSCYGSANPHKNIKLLAQLYLDGKLKLDELILNRINLNDVNTAFESFHDNTLKNVGRTMIQFDSMK